MQFDELANKIKELMTQKRPLVVAVSGFGGSGKTTLAESLKKQFADSTLLQLDNFLINHGEGDGWQGGYDWTRFEDVLKDVRAGKDLHYQWYNWGKDETKEWIDQPLPSLVIVEGVRLFYPELMEYFDLTIWVDVELEVATQRGKARDAANKSHEDPAEIATHLAKWDEVWTPKEEEFLHLFKPLENADICYTTTMNKYKTIEEFLDDLTPAKKEQVLELRSYILAAEPLLEEHIKWNAPSYIKDGEDRITFNLLNKEGVVKLVFHMGATRKENRKAEPVFKNTQLIEWVSDIRGYATFDDLRHIRSQESVIKEMVTGWLAIT